MFWERKSGKYVLAKLEKEGIITGYTLKLDYKNKEIGIFNQLLPIGNFEKDMLFIQEQFANFKGKVPKNYNPTIL